MTEVTVDAPEKDRQTRQPALHEADERHVTSLNDGPAVAFTRDSVRVYDSSLDEFVELKNRELAVLLASIYNLDD